MLHFNMSRKIKVWPLFGKTKGIKLKVLQNLKHLKNKIKRTKLEAALSSLSKNLTG